MKIRKFAIEAAHYALNFQCEDGSFPPGHNGPWDNQDTPVRVTAHYAILLLKAYLLTNDNTFEVGAQKAIGYLLGQKTKTKGALRCCISRNRNIESNGLIGQAWVVEALIEAFVVLGLKEALNVAEYLLLAHAFDFKTRLWRNLAVSGEALMINQSLNQQLWLGLMSYKTGKLSGNKELVRRAELFFEKIPAMVRPNGRIFDIWINEKIFGLRRARFSYKLKRLRKIVCLRRESEGYLSCTLAVLALIHGQAPELGIWKDEKLLLLIKTSLEFANRELFENKTEFLYRYNPSGIEFAIALDEFPWLLENPKRSFMDWLKSQIYSKRVEI